MSHFTNKLQLAFFKTGVWVSQHPGATRLGVLSLAIAAALVAAMLNLHVAAACPQGGGSCGG